jgi:cation diffusion facilitator family transporter
VPDDSDQPRGQGDDESVGTVLIAGSANLAIAIAKLVGGLISGSSAMLAEAAHSFADTLNQVFLMAALKRSQKPADARHPFGYGMERYFWSLLAAVGIFVLGAGYSILEGLKAVLHAEPLGSLTIAYAVLGLSFLFEGASWLRAVRQLSGEAEERGRGFFEHLRITSDPTAKTVAFEDTAALIGLVLAAVGITLHHLTGHGFWDGAASIAIGLLLVAVAFSLGQQN